MKYGFFEEFPSSENLSKLKYIDFPVELVVAAKNLKQFLGLKRKIGKYKCVARIIYWPILDKKDGYWFSRFANPSKMQSILDEVNKYDGKLDIMWDMEFPFFDLWKLQTYGNYNKTRKVMGELFQLPKTKKVLVSEYPFGGKLKEFLLKILDLRIGSNFKHEKIVMAYSSIFKSGFLEKQLKRMKEYPRSSVGLGCIATGIQKTELILAPDQLETDLKLLKKYKVRKVYLYRLGGLNREYLSVLRKFV